MTAYLKKNKKIRLIMILAVMLCMVFNSAVSVSAAGKKIYVRGNYLCDAVAINGKWMVPADSLDNRGEWCVLTYTYSDNRWLKINRVWDVGYKSDGTAFFKKGMMIKYRFGSNKIDVYNLSNPLEETHWLYFCDKFFFDTTLINVPVLKDGKVYIPLSLLTYVDCTPYVYDDYINITYDED